MVSAVGIPVVRASEMGRSARGPLTRAGLRVEPTSDHMRAILKHPRAGGFRSSGAVTWPDDVFTRRRIRDGDVRIVEEKKEAPKKAEAPSKSSGHSTTTA